MNTTTLTQEQIDFFQLHGYLRLPQAVPAALLSRLRAVFDTMIATGEPAREITFNENNGKAYLAGVANPCNKGDLSCLALLGQPFLLSVAETFCGPDFFPVQDFAVVKMKGDNTPVLWHLDMEHSHKETAITMGIYLDDAPEGEGALRVVPGSHNSGKTICELQREPFIEIPMQAGDVLVHDMLLAHSSAPLQHNELRRVIYFEFLPVAQTIAEALYPAEAVQLRTHLLFAAITYHGEQYPNQPLYQWKGSTPTMEVCNIAETVQNVYNNPFPGKPSAYCFEQTAG
jgi:Phytanoyl-CoA dioxygenase (PhyH)